MCGSIFIWVNPCVDDPRLGNAEGLCPNIIFHIRYTAYISMLVQLSRQ